MSENSQSVEGRRGRARRPAWRGRTAMVWLTPIPTLLLAGALTWLLIGSRGDHEPAGQVLARVNGVEVTIADVTAEARAQKRSDPALVTNDLLDTVISRELLAQEARRRGLQRRPQFPSDRRRALNQLDASTLLRVIPAILAPSEDEVSAFIASHPERFAHRTRLLLREVKYHLQGAPDFAGLPIQDVLERLQAAGIPATETENLLIAADLPDILRHALSTMTPGTVAVWRDEAVGRAIAVSSAEAFPLLGEDARKVARAELSRAARERQAADLIEQLRKRGEVRLGALRGAASGVGLQPRGVTN